MAKTPQDGPTLISGSAGQDSVGWFAVPHKNPIFEENLSQVLNIKIVAQGIYARLHRRVVTLGAQPRLQGARILVVDDNAVMRRTLRNLLESQEDWRVCDEASDGGEAVAKFDKEKFDVVVLDFQMPGMNGLDAVN